MCKARNIFFHSDIAQMAGKMDVDVKDMGINLASMSSHKVYGPKGVGAIYLSRRPRVRIDAPMSAAGDKRGASAAGRFPQRSSLALVKRARWR